MIEPDRVELPTNWLDRDVIVEVLAVAKPQASPVETRVSIVCGRGVPDRLWREFVVEQDGEPRLYTAIVHPMRVNDLDILASGPMVVLNANLGLRRG